MYRKDDKSENSELSNSSSEEEKKSVPHFILKGLWKTVWYPIRYFHYILIVAYGGLLGPLFLVGYILYRIGGGEKISTEAGELDEACAVGGILILWTLLSIGCAVGTYMGLRYAFS